MEVMIQCKLLPDEYTDFLFYLIKKDGACRIQCSPLAPFKKCYLKEILNK